MKTRGLTINCNGQLLDLSTPVAMGILNVTPDSFYDGNIHNHTDKAVAHCAGMLQAGAAIIDLGAASSKPGSSMISPEDELKRLSVVLPELIRCFPDTIISLDTYHSTTARYGIDHGISIINDISAGIFDPKMFETIAGAKVPYVVMHMQGTPQTMQQAPAYTNVVAEVIAWIRLRLEALSKWDIYDLIIDPGFGFGKTVEQNFALLKHLNAFGIFEKPVLAGISRKSMVCKPLNISPAEALNGSTALHMAALQNGASILRVHDVREAVQAITMYEQLNTETISF
ncbi:MAG: dihydropteroate synthase [Bacteroidetes bacterium]|nr:dihydropteroate synthase [Bacteroidota bacterium]